MLKPKKNISVKDIKRDPFLESIDKVQAHYYQKRALYLNIALALTVIIVGLNLYNRNKNFEIEKSSTALGKSLISIENKDYENAKFQLQRIIDDFPNNINSNLANYYLGKLFFNEGDYEKSKSHLELYINHKSNHLLRQSAVLMISNILMDNDKFEDSILLLEKFNTSNNSSFYDNMIAIQKAKVFYNSGNKIACKNIIDILLGKENLTLRQKQIVEELFSYNQG
jgi:predicted negative regulator of RcsB-dependent stress response